MKYNLQQAPRAVRPIPLIQGDKTTVLVKSIKPEDNKGTVLESEFMAYEAAPGKLIPVFGGINVDGEAIKTEAGQPFGEKFWAVRLNPLQAAINQDLFNKQSFVDNLAPVYLDELSKTIKHNCLVVEHWGDPRCVAIQSIWVNANEMGLDELGYTREMGVDIARGQMKLAKKRGDEKGYRFFKRCVAHPELLNGVTLYLVRFPVNYGDNIIAVKLRLIDMPGKILAVCAALAKLFLGDFDGDSPMAVFGVKYHTYAEMVKTIEANMADESNRDKVLAVNTSESYNSVSLRVEKLGGQKLGLRNSPLAKKEEGWKALLGYCIKQYIQEADQTSKMYGATLAFFLFSEVISDKELVKLARYAPKEIRGYRNFKIAYDRFVADKSKVNRTALCRQIIAAAGKNLMETVFDARKGTEEEAAVMVSALVAMARDGRVDWDALEKSGVWTKPFRMLHSYLWLWDEENGKYKFNLRQKLSQMNFALDAIWVKRRTWKSGTIKTEVLYNLAKGADGVVSMDNIIKVIEGDFGDYSHEFLEENNYTENFKVREYRPNWPTQISGLDSLRCIVADMDSANKLLAKSTPLRFTMNNGVLYIRKDKGDRADLMGLIGACEVKPWGNAEIIAANHINRVCNTHLMNLFASPYPAVFGKEQVHMTRGLAKQLTQGFYLTRFWGLMAHVAIQAWDDAHNPDISNPEGKNPLALVRQKVRTAMQALPLCDEVGATVASDELVMAYPTEGPSADRIKMDFAAEALRLGANHFQTSKNDPASIFGINAPGFNVSMLALAVDPFFQAACDRRWWREVRSFIGTALESAESRPLPWEGVIDPDAYHTGLRKRMFVANCVVFNCFANSGKADDIHCTKDGQHKMRSSTVRYKTLSESEYQEWFTQLSEEDAAIVLPYISQVPVKKAFNVTIMRYRVPSSLEEVRALHFKAQVAGTKGICVGMNGRFFASYDPDLHKVGAYSDEQLEKLERLGKGFIIDLILAADTVVGKQSHVLLYMGSSQLEGGYIVDPSMSGEELKADISERLVREGKDPDGYMYLYRIEDDNTLVPHLDDEGNHAHVPAGQALVFRPDFQSDDTWVKLKQGIRLSHDEIALLGEGFAIDEDAKERLALLVAAYELLKELMEAEPESDTDTE